MFQSRNNELNKSSLSEAKSVAIKHYHLIQKRTPRRQAYVRSLYFKKDKIFISQFFTHLNQKNRSDQLRRVRLFPVAIDLIRNNTIDPKSIQDPNSSSYSLHRFEGMTKDGKIFFVQIKENKKTNRKGFISVFPKKT